MRSDIVSAAEEVRAALNFIETAKGLVAPTEGNL